MLHKPQPNTSKLDGLAVEVVRAALTWERDRHESGRSYNEPATALALDTAVRGYLQALIDETVPKQPMVETTGDTSSPEEKQDR